LAFVVLLFLAPLSKRSLQANYNDSRPWQLGGHRPRAVDAADMDAKAIRRAALITLRRAICERFPPGRGHDTWLAWFERLSVRVSRKVAAAAAEIDVVRFHRHPFEWAHADECLP